MTDQPNGGKGMHVGKFEASLAIMPWMLDDQVHRRCVRVQSKRENWNLQS